MKTATTVAAAGLVLACADQILPGPAPDGLTVLGLAMAGLGTSILLLIHAPERIDDDDHRP